MMVGAAMGSRPVQKPVGQLGGMRFEHGETGMRLPVVCTGNQKTDIKPV